MKANHEMGLFDRITTVLSRNGSDKRSVAVGHTGTVMAGLRDTIDYGVTVNNDKALHNTALYAGVRLIAENIASLPKSLKYYDGSEMRIAVDHPAYRLINVRPNSYTNAFAFWMTIGTWFKGWGEAFAVIKRDASGMPQELHQIHPREVTNITLVNGRKWYQIVVGDSNRSFLSGTYSDDDILHFMEMSLDGIRGINPIVYNAAALGKSFATEKFASEFYRKGGNIKAVMETDGHLQQDEYEEFMNHMQSAQGNFSTPLLEYGIKYKQLSIDPVAEQLVQSEILSIQDICRLLNVPPHMIAELSHATFSNIEHQTIQFVQYCLRPIIKRFETELECKLFFENEQGKYDVKFILDGLMRGDTAARSAYYHNAILDGYMSRNEVRELEGLERAEGLDKYLYPANENEAGAPNIE